MTISDINSYVSHRTGTDTTIYSAALRLISTNRHYHKIVTMILDSMDGWDWDDSNRSEYAEATTDLVASQQDYLFPTGALKIKRVEAKLDGTNWKKLEPFDVNQSSNALDTTSIANDFNTSQPYYDVTANAIKLYPIPTSNVTGGLKIWYVREPEEFTSAQVTSGTREPGFDEPFHIMVALGMCYDWFVAKDREGVQLKSVMEELADYEQRLRKFYGSKQTDKAYTLTPAFIDYN